ncbi:MAG: YifB family Mg chelatase-like AAA ATPase, partial [Parcubacteria group bacterium]|nr:YifB family Mg chelatase-like AAA ATPase [Parcubacteria group bacterium]
MSSPQKLAKVFSAQISGLKTQIITVEVDVFRGFHSFSVVGLPDKAVEESRDRISSAIKSVGFGSPKSEGQQKIVVSLAPADLKKEGPLFDLPMALAYLNAVKAIRFSPEGRLFLGELSLGGELQPLKGALLLSQGARDAGFKELYVPFENAREAALIDGISVFGVHDLKEIVAHINERRLEPELAIALALPKKKLKPFPQTPFEATRKESALSLIDVRGQETAKRGLEIAAAGGHNIAFFGPPGTGKTLLAKAFASILPPLSFAEALEVTGIHSTVRHLKGELVTFPPFRAPHHTSSHVAVIGGGTYPKPGEATLAHRGVLFLDEFPEFDKRVIESLREPLESGEVSISRARGSERLPAEFILIAAMNPCPCGFLNDPRKECACSPSQVAKYKRKISGPIIDRIDMWIEVPRI